MRYPSSFIAECSFLSAGDEVLLIQWKAVMSAVSSVLCHDAVQLKAGHVMLSFLLLTS